MPQIETYGGEDFADLSTLLDKGLFEVIRLSNVGEGAAKMAQSGNNDLMNDPPCHSRACAIQDCLSKNQFNEAKCRSQVDALYDCCNRFYVQNGDDAKTVSCPKASLLRLKMKQRAQETGSK